MEKDDNPRAIDDSQDWAECPVETRIIVERMAHGLRFTDPRGAKGSIYMSLIFAAVFAMFAILLVVASLAKSHSTGNSIGGFLVGVMFGFAAVKFADGARRFAALPTIIDVNAHGLSISHPTDGYKRWTKDQVKIRCDRNALVIGKPGVRGTPLLHARDDREKQWLKSQLEAALAKYANERAEADNSER